MKTVIQRPTGLLILLFFSYFFISLARRAIQNIYPIIPTEHKGNKGNTHLGLIITAQTLGYTVTKLVGGVLMDHLNPLNVFIYSLISVSGFLFLLSVSSHWLVWLLLNGLTGITLGSGWPAISKLLRMHISPQELATWWGIISSSANVAGCLGSWISIGIVSISVLIFGDSAWIAPFIIVGILCIISALLLIVYQRLQTAHLTKLDNKIHTKTISTESLISNKCSPIEILTNDQSFPRNPDSVLKHRKILDEKAEQKMNCTNDQHYQRTQPVKLTVIHQISRLFLTLSPRQRLLLFSSATVHMCSTFLRYAIADWIGVMLTENQNAYPKSVANLVVSSYECGGILGCMLVGVVADLNLFNKNNSWASRRMPFIIIQMLITSVTLLCLSWVAEHKAPLTVLVLVSSLLGITVLGTISLCGVLAVELAHLVLVVLHMHLVLSLQTLVLS
ncbi:unnamed protein product [Heterobilharzia americana]|nr:unnamed protein product [Heterobilharzia americana]